MYFDSVFRCLKRVPASKTCLSDFVLVSHVSGQCWQNVRCQEVTTVSHIVLEIDFLLAMMLRIKHGGQSSYLFISYLDI